MSKRHGEHMLTTSTSLTSERWDNKRKHSKNKKAQVRQQSVEKVQKENAPTDSRQTEQQYRRIVKELNIGPTVDLRTFFNAFYMLKPRIKTADIIQTEEVLLSMWKIAGGIHNKHIDQKTLYQLYLYTENALQQNDLEATKNLEKFRNHPIFAKKQEVAETKRTVSNLDSVEISIKIRDNVWEKVRITPSTSVDDLIVSISLKHKLPASKVKLLKKLMSAHIKKQLTRITEESLQTLSDLSGVFEQLD